MVVPGEEYEMPISDGERNNNNPRVGLRRTHSDSALFQQHDDDEHDSITSSWAAPVQGGSHSPPRTPRTKLKHAESEPPPRSIPEKMAQGALSGTLELLKLAGGVTLSTTGKIVAPPIHVTRTLIMPALWDGFVDYLKHTTPTRVKDWFRILSSSVHHVVTVIKNTEKGKIFRTKVVKLGGDIVDVVSSEAARQALIDGTASVVKLCEALNTPEMKLFLDQLSVLGCRMVDVASSGRNKQLMHDLSDVVWSALQVTTDPAATLALAEVTAYINHALEMEDTIHRGKNKKAKLAAQRRYERNLQQRQTYVDRRLLQDPDSTAEQVLLSSMGGLQQQNDEDQDVVPANIQMPTSSANENDWGQHAETVNTDQWKDDVDIGYLNERISLRAAVMERQKTQRLSNKTEDVAPSGTAESASIMPPTKSDPGSPRPPTTNEPTRQEPRVKHDLEELDAFVTKAKTANENKRAPRSGLAYEPSSLSDQPPPWEDISETQEVLHETPVNANEPASSRFYRYLDEFMNKERTETINRLLAEDREKDLSWYPRAAAAAGAGNERGQDTLKGRLKQMKRDMAKDVGVGAHHQHKVSKEERQAAAIRECVFLALYLLWFVLGCYGVYALFLRVGFLATKSTTTATGPTPAIHQQQEMVVRIVRQVVHVTQEGKVLQTTTGDPLPSLDNEDALSACIANALG